MEEEGNSKKTTTQQSNFLRCAGVVLPYLTPAELASISSTCKTLRHHSTQLTSRRTLDASRSLEHLPIPFLNNPTSPHPPYSYFLYTPTQTHRAGAHPRQPWGSHNDAPSTRPDPFLFRVEGATGCECGGGRCPCGLVVERECGPSCGCGPGCGKRASQGGVRVRLKVVRGDDRKGWGLFADQLITTGRFVCEYAGELLSTKEARQRQQTYDKLASSGRLAPALLVVKEHLPSGNMCMRINIDATRIGNVARFINHSCDGGNLDTVIMRSSGALLPRVCFFASRDIQENEELTFSYGDVRLEPNGQPCFCGTLSCAGILPSEHT